MATTPRLLLPRPAGADTFTIASILDSIVDILDNAGLWQTGTFAGRPAANVPKPGLFYRSTDTGDVSVTDGATWFTVTPGNRSNFNARRSSQSIPNSTNTKVQFDTEIFDLASDFDPVTNFRFVAPVKGIYEFALRASFVSSGSPESMSFYLTKNGIGNNAFGTGEAWLDLFDKAVSNAAVAQLSLAAGDYIEVAVSHTNGAARTINNPNFAAKLLAQIP